MSEQGNAHLSGGTIYGSAVGTNHGTISIQLPPERRETPDRVAQATTLLAQLPLDDVPSVARLPDGSRMRLPRNATFVGRTQELQQLAAMLSTGRTSAIATGVGGIGKSSLVTEFAHRYGQYFAGGVFWLSFANPATVHFEIAACGGKGFLDLHPQFADLNLPDQVNLVQTYWAQTLPCLLIFDNCEAEDLLKFAPTTGAARVLITSRRRQWNPTRGVTVLRLGKLDRADSVDLLPNTWL